MKKNIGTFLMLASLLGVVPFCANRITDGGGTGTGNGKVSGKIVNEQGKGVAGAKVRLVPSSFNPQTGSGKILAKVDSATTDSTGTYTADVDSGIYNVMADSGGKLAFQDSVVVPKDSQVTVPAVTLKLPGSVLGTVELQDNDDPRTVFVIVLGTNTFSMANASGAFSISNMAEGDYMVRFLSTLDDYDILEQEISVRAGMADTLRSSVALPFKGIPTPKGLKLEYDTLKQIVTLTWNKADTSLVKGYNVYRRRTDSTFRPINAALVTDTVLQDSSLTQDSSYEYKITAVNKADDEGGKSAGLSAKIIPAFKLIKKVDLTKISTSLSAVIADFDGTKYLVLSRYPQAAIFVFDSTDAVVDTYGVKILSDPMDLAVDKNLNMYVVDSDSSKIFKFSKTGILSGDWHVSQKLRLQIFDTLIYVGGTTGVNCYDLDGNLKNSFVYPQPINALAIANFDTFYIYGNKTMVVTTQNGDQLKILWDTDLSNLQTYNGCADLQLIRSSNNLLFTLNQTLYLIDNSGNLLMKMPCAYTTSLFFSDKDATIWAADIRGFINRFHK